MLFSNRYKFLFVHIAKTAGTSIQTVLKKLRRRDPLAYPQLLCYNISRFFDNRIGCKIPRHGRVVTAYDMLPREVFEKLFKFAFVRNPWDIQVSSYHHTLREMPELLKNNQCEDFGDFLRWSLDPERPYEHWFQQLNQNMIDYMVNLDGSLLIDYVGRFENLEEDWGEVCERIGIPKEKVETQAATVADLVAELKAREDRYEAAFADLTALRVALDQELADFDAPLAGVREVAFFPPMTGG